MHFSNWFMQLEAEKPRDLPCVSWRPRRARGMVQSKLEGLRTRGWSRKSPSEPKGPRIRSTGVRGQE